MVEKIPDILGKRFRYVHDEGRVVDAVVQQSLGLHGGRSFIFVGLVDNTDEQVILKYPRPGEDVLKEYRIIREMRNTRAKDNLPSCWKTDIDGTTVLVMEMMAKNEQWQSLKNDGRIAPSEVVRGARQALFLLDCTHQKRIVNTDIKIENCFWCEGDRFVLLDWNEYAFFDRTIAKDEQERFDHLRRQNFLTILGFIYYMLIGVDLPNPIPIVESPEPEKWARSPYLLRKLIKELRSENGLLSFKELDLQLQSLENGLIKKERGDWATMLDQADQLISKEQISQEMLAEVKNILSLIFFAKAPEEIIERANLINDKIRDTKIHDDDALRTAEQEVIHLLEERRAEAAMRLGEKSMQDIHLPNSHKWKLAKLLSISKSIFDQIKAKEYLDPSDAKLVAAAINDVNGIAEISNHTIKQQLLALFEFFAECQEWVDSLFDLSESSYSKKIDKLNSFEQWMETKRGEEIAHPMTIQVVRSRIPDWDTHAMEQAIYVKQIAERRAALEDEFVRSVEKVMSQYGLSLEAAVDAVDDLVRNVPEEIAGTHKVEVIQNLQLQLRRKDWVLVLQMLKEEGSEVSSPLTKLYKEIINSQIKAWLANIEARKKYRPELDWLNKLFSLSKDDDLLNYDQSVAANIIEAYRRADRTDESSLLRCQELNIEPWMRSADDEALSADAFLKLVSLQQYKTEIEQAKSGFQSRIEGSASEIKQLIAVTENEKNKIEQLGEDLGNLEKVLNENINKLDSLSRARKRDMRNLISRIYEDYPKNLFEHPEWWQLLRSGRLGELEQRIAEYEKSSTDLDQAPIAEWKKRIELVKELDRFLQLEGTYKRKPDHLIEKEILLKMLVPVSIWRGAEEYHQKKHNEIYENFRSKK